MGIDITNAVKLIKGFLLFLKIKLKIWYNMYSVYICLLSSQFQKCLKTLLHVEQK